ncbi:MAG TPA: metallophosphoesterase [Desulfobacterales bacterium]|nr:metallophosphoesterase [Desulfobacterales bacterium]
MPRIAAMLLLVTALGTFASCRYGLGEAFGRPSPVDERVVDASAAAPSAPTVGNLDNYVFAVISDTHFVAEADPPAAGRLSAFLASKLAEFVIVPGDLADAGLPEEYARYAAWTASLDLDGFPVYSAIGNHDLYNGGWSTFRTAVGASYYSFAIGTRSFYFLDSGNGTLGRDQIAMLRDAFAGDLNPKVVITHYPLYDGDDSQYYELTNTAERAALVDLYARSGVELLLEGHTHALNHTTIGPMEEWVCPSLQGPGGEGRCLVVTVASGAIASVTYETF